MSNASRTASKPPVSLLPKLGSRRLSPRSNQPIRTRAAMKKPQTGGQSLGVRPRTTRSAIRSQIICTNEVCSLSFVSLIYASSCKGFSFLTWLTSHEERVHLLAHILRLVVEPNGKQHSDIRKLGVNVKKLEETTAEALSSFFLDNEANARKKPYLNEIFKVARQEERFKNGEIGKLIDCFMHCAI